MHTYWNNIVWFNETGINSHHHIWRKKNDAYMPENTIPIVKDDGTNVMAQRHVFLHILSEDNTK